MADTLGYRRRMIRYAIANLKLKGAISTSESGGGRGHATVYHVTWNLWLKCEKARARRDAAEGAETVQHSAPIKKAETVQHSAPIKKLNSAMRDHKQCNGVHPKESGRELRTPEGVSPGVGSALKRAVSGLFKGVKNTSKPAETQKAELRQWVKEKGD